MKCGAVGRAEMPSDGFFLRLSDKFTVEAVKLNISRHEGHRYAFEIRQYT